MDRSALLNLNAGAASRVMACPWSSPILLERQAATRFVVTCRHCRQVHAIGRIRTWVDTGPGICASLRKWPRIGGTGVPPGRCLLNRVEAIDWSADPPCRSCADSFVRLGRGHQPSECPDGLVSGGCSMSTPSCWALTTCGRCGRRGLRRGDARYRAGRFGASGECDKCSKPSILLFRCMNRHAGAIVAGQGPPLVALSSGQRRYPQAPGMSSDITWCMSY